MKVSTFSDGLISLIRGFEGFRTRPYLCPAGVPTIGYGSTYYEDGRRVSLQDTPITQEEAIRLLYHQMGPIAKYVDTYTRDDITQHQFDALGDFIYNFGPGRLKTSRLLKKVNANPNDTTIRDSFMAWVFSGDGSHNGKDDDWDGLIDEAGEKKRMDGLVRRCQARVDLYFRP